MYHLQIVTCFPSCPSSTSGQAYVMPCFPLFPLHPSFHGKVTQMSGTEGSHDILQRVPQFEQEREMYSRYPMEQCTYYLEIQLFFLPNSLMTERYAVYKNIVSEHQEKKKDKGKGAIKKRKYQHKNKLHKLTINFKRTHKRGQLGQRIIPLALKAVRPWHSLAVGIKTIKES